MPSTPELIAALNDNISTYSIVPDQDYIIHQMYTGIDQECPDIDETLIDSEDISIISLATIDHTTTEVSDDYNYLAHFDVIQTCTDSQSTTQSIDDVIMLSQSSDGCHDNEMTCIDDDYEYLAQVNNSCDDTTKITSMDHYSSVTEDYAVCDDDFIWD